MREERERDRREKGRGDTVTHVAAAGGQVEVMKMLIAEGADFNNPSSSDGNTPLMRACGGDGTTPPHRFIEVARMLIEAA